jgi:hypothetical protein
MNTVKFIKVANDATSRFTKFTAFEFTIQADSLAFTQDALYQNCLSQLPAILSGDISPLTRESYSGTDEEWNRLKDVVTKADRADFAIKLDTILRKIAITYPRELDVVTMSTDEKIGFFKFLSDTLTELNTN